MKKKFPKVVIIIAAVVIAVAVVAGAAVLIAGKLGGNTDKAVVYADTVETVLGYGNAGFVNRYTGLVETQKSVDIKADSDKTVKNVFVSVGDVVEEGTPLFEYDTDELSLKLAEANLEIERLNNSLDSSNKQIEQLEKDRKKASEEDKLNYTAEILSLQSSVWQMEYDIKVKKLEAENLQKSLETAVVTSTAAGVVKSINENNNNNNEYGYGYGGGSSDAFISIVATGDYRVKGTIDEQNVYEIYEEMPVLVYSRVDNTVWTGVIEEINTESTEDNNNNGYYYDGGMGESASKYAFYVKLDNSENLLIGQHVYIEPDFGQYNDDGSIKISEGFIVFDEAEPYVWSLDKNGKLEKRTVTLGDYDAFSGVYVITGGLSLQDYISYPSEYCKVGGTVIKDTGNTIDESIYSRDDAGFDDYYSEDEHTYDYDDETGVLTEYDADGNIVSICDADGNMTFFDADGNEITADEYYGQFADDTFADSDFFGIEEEAEVQ